MKQVAPTVQDLFQVTRADWLESARVAARDLLRNRLTITIEDVLTVCPRPKYLHHNVTGSVFQSREFAPIGFASSRRSSSHGRVVRMWTLSDEYQPVVEKDCE